MIKLYGFSLIRNAIKYDYSFKEALLSMAPLVQYSVVAVGKSEDETLKVAGEIPNIKIIETVWNQDLKQGLVLSDETNKALTSLRSSLSGDELKSAWGIYLQADECLHEDDFEILRHDIEEAERGGYDAIMFSYLHFWQTHHFIATAKRWYPHEVRAIKLDSSIESWGDAQGFRHYQKPFYSKARIYHYGHVRDPKVYLKKMEDMSALYSKNATESKYYNAKDRDKKDDHQCIFYWGTHPQVMHERILRLGDVLELPPREEVYIVGNPKEITPHFLSRLNVAQIHWVDSMGKVPSDKKKLAVKLHATLMDKLLGKTHVPEKMRSKHAKPWPIEFLLLLKLSEKGFGFK